MKQDLKAIALAAAALGVAGYTYNYLMTVRKQKAIRAEIQKNLDLDLEAIRLASERVAERVRSGEFDHCLSYDALLAFNQEVDFQKIAVRNS